MTPTLHRALLPLTLAAALAGCLSPEQAQPVQATGRLSVHLMPWEGRAEGAEAPASYEAELLDPTGRAVARRAALGAEATVDFSEVPEGAYTLSVKALSGQGRAVNFDAPAPSAAGAFQVGAGQSTQGQAMVPMARQGAASRYAQLGRLQIGITLQDGGPADRMQGVVVASTVSAPATAGIAATPGAIAAKKASAIDDEGRCMLYAEIAPSLPYRFTAFTSSRAGDDLQYLGPATLQLRTRVDRENGDRPTLALNYPGSGLKLYMDDAGAFVATSMAFPGRGSAGAFSFLDPEPVPGATFYSDRYPQGTPARRYYWQLADHAIGDVYLGAKPGDGLFALHLPQGDRVLHIVRL